MVDNDADKAMKQGSRWGPKKKAFSVPDKENLNEAVSKLSKMNLNESPASIVPGSSLFETSNVKPPAQKVMFRHVLTPFSVSKDTCRKLQNALASKQSVLAREFPESRNMWTIAIAAPNQRIVLETTVNYSPDKISYLRGVFLNFHKKGFFLWLAGEKGWILDPEQKSWAEFLDALNKLQDVFNLMAPDAVKKQMESSTKLLWKKERHIQEAVFDIRQVLEVLWGLNDTNKHRTVLVGKSTRNSTPEGRWRLIMTQVRKLLRRSIFGPDAPVQWAAHPACNRYNLSFITSGTMFEIIEGLIVIMKNLFFGLATEEHQHDCLGTIWYNKKNGEYPAAFKTTDVSLPDFETPESFKKLLNRGTVAAGTRIIFE